MSSFQRSISAALAAMTFALPKTANASPASEVASAFDEGDHFDIHGRIDYETTIKSAAIKRELSGFAGADPNGGLAIAKDLVYHNTRHTLVPRIDVGVFHDISLSLALPIVIHDSRELEFDQRDKPCQFGDGGTAATCIDAGNSTTIRDGLLPEGGYDAADPAGPGPGGATIFRGQGRSGLDQFHVGLTWAAMNQERDRTKPTWKIGAELRLAIGQVMRFDAESPDSETGISRGVHELYLFTSTAKKIAWAIPRFELWYLAPIGKRGESLFRDLGYGQTSAGPQHRAGSKFALEAIVWQRKDADQRVSIDVGGDLTAVLEGRGYSEMWEVFAYAGRAEASGPLVLDSNPTQGGVQAQSYPGISNIQNYLRFGGHLGVSAHIGPHVRIEGAFKAISDQAHIITFADSGIDGPDADSLVNPMTEEVNPSYVETIDSVGHRYRVEESMAYQVYFSSRVLF